MKKLNTADFKAIAQIATACRCAILRMTTLAASGHPGGSMSSLDVLITLYNMINQHPKSPYLPERDRVVVSNGHISPAVYSVLATLGYFDPDAVVAEFRLAGSEFEGHIERNLPGIEWTSGNLGQGLSAGCGFALANKIKGLDTQIFVMMGDGEQQKGQISEARRFAVKHHLTNITAIIDYNQLQISGDIHQVMPQNIKANWESDGWNVIEIDGHDLTQIHDALHTVTALDQPVMLLAHTVMGKGVGFMENLAKYHGSPLSETQLVTALTELCGSDLPDESCLTGSDFTSDCPSESLSAVDLKTWIANCRDIDYYKLLRERKKQQGCVPFPPLQNDNLSFTAGDTIVYQDETDNRSAWGNAIADLAKLNQDNRMPIVVFDCDLQSSVKTADFEKINPTHFIQSGIMEHNTAVVSGAMSTCGISTWWAEFGMFGIDEVYNMLRLNDINHANLKVIATHVGVDVGEDGRTHQCVDYIGLIRNLFHFGLLCPADPNQTDRIIRYLINTPGNFVCTMGRSKLPILRTTEGKLFYDANYSFEYGKADLLREGTDAALIVTGTPVGRALAAVDRLRSSGISVQLWYVASPLVVDRDMLVKAAQTGTIFTVEDHNVHSGLGSIFADAMVEQQLSAKLTKLGVRDYPISGTSDDVFAWAGLSPESIIKTISGALKS